jgi:hypothetical protein
MLQHATQASFSRLNPGILLFALLAVAQKFLFANSGGSRHFVQSRVHTHSKFERQESPYKGKRQ